MIYKMNGNKNLLVLFAAVATYSIALLSHRSFEKPLIKVSKQESSLNFNQDFLRIFSVGNKKLIADVLWVQTLLESDLEHYGRADLGNWMYLRFSTISVLDPKFYENYRYGGIYLSIVKDDVEGADKIFELGLKHYPDDFHLNYHAGFNAYFEMDDSIKGLKYLERIKDNPKASLIITSIVNKLKLANGLNIEDTYELVLTNYNETEDPVLKEKLGRDLYSIRAEIDLNCLNSNKTNCQRTDLEGNAYILKGNIFVAPKPFEPFRLKKKSDLKKK